jgi:hypothetical protein
VFGQYSGAAVTPVNGHVFGAYVNVSDHTLGGLAQLRLSFYPNIDFGFHGGLSRLEAGGTLGDRTTLRMGTDVRWQLTGLERLPADFAVGATLGVEASDEYKVITVGPSVLMSKPLGEGGAGTFVPYGGLALLFNSRDAFGVEDSDISLPLRLGFETRMWPEARLIAELQLYITDRYNDDVGFTTGVNLPF